MIVVIILLMASLFIFCRVSRLKRKILRLIGSDRIYEQMKSLYPEKEVDYEYSRYYEKKIKWLLAMILVGAAMSFAMGIAADANPVIGNSNRIDRNGYGKGDRNISLYVSDDSMIKKQKIDIKISDQKYSSEETDRLARQLTDQIHLLIKGENKSLDKVMYNLNLMNSVEGYPFKIVWRTEKPTIINRKGEIDTKRLKEELETSGEESLVIRLFANITYEDYEQDLEMAVNIVPIPYDSEQMFMEEITKSIESANESSRESETVSLPGIVMGRRINYSEDSGSRDIVVFALALICALAVYFGRDDDLNKQVRERNSQMEDDYPRIVNQYTLYYCAGMNSKSIWKEICSDYRKSINSSSDRRYAYEEMLRTEAAMADGLGENAAYSEFGKNCRLRRYRRFVSLLQQSLTKGKDQMAEDLRKESEEAGAEKIRTAMIRGEEAGTKLLIPMFLMLGIVLLIVVVPAFISFNI